MHFAVWQRIRSLVTILTDTCTSFRGMWPEIHLFFNYELTSVSSAFPEMVITEHSATGLPLTGTLPLQFTPPTFWQLFARCCAVQHRATSRVRYGARRLLAVQSCAMVKQQRRLRTRWRQRPTASGIRLCGSNEDIAAQDRLPSNGCEIVRDIGFNFQGQTL